MKSLFSHMKVKAIIAGIILILIGCSTLYWYFGYHVKTPEYALKMIEESITKHDMNKFSKYVDKQSLLEDLANDVVESITSSDQQTANGTGFAMQEYSSIFKTAFVKGFDTALTNYVTYGKQDTDNQPAADSDTANSNDLLETVGVNNLTVTGYKILSIDTQTKKAIVQVDTTQNDIEKPFSFRVIMAQQDDGHWMAVKVDNFSDFLIMLNKERKQGMLLYINKTDALMNEHKKTFKNIEGQLQDIRNSGNIGSDAVRNNLKDIINNDMLPHWHMLKEALSAINAPKSATTIQNLRVKICDLYIAYYENYAKWLDDKDVKSLRDAEASLKKARTLEANESDLTNIIKRDLSQ